MPNSVLPMMAAEMKFQILTRMSLGRFKAPLPIITLLFAAFPLFLILALHFYALEAYFYLGHWPTYNNPDPKQLGWWTQHAALNAGLMISPLAFAMAISLAIFGRIRSRDFPLWAALITAIASYSLLIGFGRLDPGGLLSWFMD